MDDELKEQIIKLMKEKLRINHLSREGYVGDNGKGGMYETYHSIELIIDDEVISEISI